MAKKTKGPSRKTKAQPTLFAEPSVVETDVPTTPTGTPSADPAAAPSGEPPAKDHSMTQASQDKRSSKSAKHNGAKNDRGALPDGLTDALLLRAYENMLLSRMLDDKMLVLLKQGKSYFHIGGMGHEAAQTAAAFALTPGRDWAYPYYRDQALCTGLGMTAEEIFLCFLAREGDPNSGGRQMPQHYGHKKWNIPSQSSPTGTQFLQATGCALGGVRQYHEVHKKNGKSPDYDVTIVCAGDGTTSQGDFHEALNWASREKAPVIFMIEDNGYAISVPVADQTPGGKVSNLGRGYDGLTTVEVDGCDLVASYEVLRDAVARARQGEGPTLVVADVVRLLPHSSSDDQRKYRPADELARDKARDPNPALRQLLLDRKVATESELDALAVRVKQDIDDAADRAEAAPMPARDTATRWVLSENPEPPLTTPQTSGDDGVVLVDAINRALAEEMARDPKVLVFGEDVAGNKGGVFTATRGLTEKFGDERCFNSPLAESSIVGVAIGLTLRGYKPVPEIQFGDYVWTAMMQIRNEVATMRYRSNNQWTAPVVIRIPIGGYIHGALCHSQNIESFFAHIPGLKIALPSTALDAYGLLKTAIRGDDPVLFLEHKGLYRQGHCKSLLPTDPEWCLPFGKASIRRQGSDLTVITYGALVQRALASAETLKDEGFDCEVIDLRSLNPVDWETLETSVKKTGKCLVLHEDCRFVGYGAEIAAEITERCFEHLDGPVRRLAGEDTPVPYNWDLEEEILVQPEDVLKAMRDLAQY